MKSFEFFRIPSARGANWLIILVPEIGGFFQGGWGN